MLWALEWTRHQSNLETEMVKQGISKFRVMAATGLVVMVLASAPANANHGHNYVAPLAAFIAFSAFVHNNNHSNHRHGHGHGYGHRQHRRHSQIGYHQPRKKHHRH